MANRSGEQHPFGRVLEDETVDQENGEAATS